jgi:hypothetical protein
MHDQLLAEQEQAGKLPGEEDLALAVLPGNDEPTSNADQLPPASSPSRPQGRSAATGPEDPESRAQLNRLDARRGDVARDRLNSRVLNADRHA